MRLKLEKKVEIIKNQLRLTESILEDCRNATIEGATPSASWSKQADEMAASISRGYMALNLIAFYKGYNNRRKANQIANELMF
jgi:hypothetical protein